MWRVRAGMLALVIVCSTAQASNWLSLSKNDAGTVENFIDVSSLRIAGNIRRAWFKFAYKTHTEKGTDGKYKSYTVAKTAFNCTEEMSRFEAVNTYLEDGTNESVPAAYYPDPWKPVAPDTVNSYEMQFICTWKP
jgi:hypothetical protein